MELSSGQDRVAELHYRLVYETERLVRAGIHLELATLAVGDARFEDAARHFREALLLDARLVRARDGLSELGQRAQEKPAARTGVRGFLDRLRRRAA
jgi:hypothetical protein